MFNNNRTIKYQESHEQLPKEIFFDYTKCIDTLDQLVDRTADYLLEDEKYTDAFGLKKTRLKCGDNIEKLKKKIIKELTPSVYYHPLEERNYEFSVYSDVIIPDDDKDKKSKPATRFTNLKGENVPFSSLVGKIIVGIPSLNYYLNKSSGLSICRIMREFVILKVEKFGFSGGIPKVTQNIMQSNPELFMKMIEEYEESEKLANEESSEHYNEQSDDFEVSSTKVADIMDAY